MKTNRSQFNLYMCSLVTAVALTLSGCASDSANKTLQGQNAFGSLNLTTQQYTELYNDANEDQSFKALILLTRSNIVSGDTKQAKVLLGKLYQTAKTDAETDEANLVHAMLMSKLGNNTDALNLLKKINYKGLNRQALTYFLILNSNVNARLYTKSKDLKFEMAAFKSQAELLKIVDGKNDRLKILKQCMKLLEPVDEKTLIRAAAATSSETDKGFYEYAVISRSASSDLKVAALKDFEEKYPNHPLVELFADEGLLSGGNVADADEKESEADKNAVAADINKDSIFTINDGDKIAVLLPLSGRFAPIVGEPAKLGIVTALKDRDSKSQVIFYDTNKSGIEEILKKVNSNGTKLIIGPILKPEVNALNNAGNKLPNITFNRGDSTPSKQWYFDLGPVYEGAIAAAKIYDDGHKAPVIISQSNDASSVRAKESFIATLKKAGITPMQCSFAESSSIKKAIKNCPLDKADSAYINASAVDAVTLKAAVPGTVKVYLTDKSYLGVNNTSQELALKGAVLGDMPWLLTDSPLKDNFMKALPKANTQVQRIFAAAYDSVAFAFSISDLAANKDDVLHGLTGDISLGKNGLIEASPMWVELGSLR
ncbi:MAG: penicillin-binding protein activator [Succinivibrio sp.]